MFSLASLKLRLFPQCPHGDYFPKLEDSFLSHCFFGLTKNGESNFGLSDSSNLSRPLTGQRKSAPSNQRYSFSPCVAFRSKGVSVSFTLSVHSRLLYRVSRFTTAFSCIILPSLLQIFRYFAADRACCSCIFCNSRPFGHQKREQQSVTPFL